MQKQSPFDDKYFYIFYASLRNTTVISIKYVCMDQCTNYKLCVYKLYIHKIYQIVYLLILVAIISLPEEDWVYKRLISGSYDLRINLTARRQDTHIKTQIESNVFREHHIPLDFVFCLTLPTLGRPRNASGFMHQGNSIIFYVPRLKLVIFRVFRKVAKNVVSVDLILNKEYHSIMYDNCRSSFAWCSASSFDTKAE
jgi:hypothetical protein